MSSRLAPHDCHDLTSLRALIDAVDDALFDLFAERMACIHRATELKACKGLPANVPSRVTEVVENARQRAADRALDPELYGSIWRLIVKTSTVEEVRRLGQMGRGQ